MANIKPDPQIASPIQIQRLINRLEDWCEQLRQLKVKGQLGGDMAMPSDHHLHQDLQLLGVSAKIDDINEMAALSKHLQAWLDSAPIVHMTFSTPPSQRAKGVIVQWLHANVDPGLLADFKVDSKIAAGFMLRTKNHLYDFTANQVLWDNRGRIGEMVKHAG